ncbi:hypothetical protein [Nitrospira moscoviensis]|jgi:hypothetical protein|uniref:Uncharacterized protein n=1 Tax=Nitrospira moscoviensis TaxID=42253 RepID=A0A0K2GED5_NITMO|nr:hypothetical protein [Nitrospira moscoviensis]ALA59313.1 exported protein of unknown function [Nitrospira moscoviensis]
MGCIALIPRIISVSLVLILFGLTFNAYACLLPLFSAGQTPMGCGSSTDQPVREYCDVFKTFSVEHADQSHPWLDIQTSSLEQAIVVSLIDPPGIAPPRFYDFLAPPVDEVLAKLTVLRL